MRRPQTGVTRRIAAALESLSLEDWLKWPEAIGPHALYVLSATVCLTIRNCRVMGRWALHLSFECAFRAVAMSGVRWTHFSKISAIECRSTRDRRMELCCIIESTGRRVRDAQVVGRPAVVDGGQTVVY